jgi:hypothetical protein
MGSDKVVESDSRAKLRQIFATRIYEAVEQVIDTEDNPAAGDEE